MRLITLNLWGGKLYGELSAFLKREARRTDIFCFQEMFAQEGGDFDAWDGAHPDLYSGLSRILVGFDGRVGEPYTHFGERLAIFTKGVDILRGGEMWLCRMRPIEYKGRTDDIGSRMQWAEIDARGKNVTVMNVHGLWQPYSKSDSRGTVSQSRKILKFLDGRGGEAILCGDLNLNPDTRSIGMLGKRMRNLVVEHKAKSTRNHYAHPLAGNYADYIFASGGLGVRSFAVLPDIVSDHQALSLDFA
jgi:endonuclease/exonuclease/phosphatase family metal-dependent hydrolase